MNNYDGLIEIAKKILKNKQNGLTFVSLLDEVAKAAKVSDTEKADIAADFYQSLIESNLFFYDSKSSTWGLRENITFDSFQKMNDIFNSNASDDVKESDYRSDMSQIEIAELENGNRNDKTARLDLDSEEDDDANINPDMDIDLEEEE